MRRTRRYTTARRQRAERRGRLAEWLCLWHLRLRGWRIVARGWRCPAGEIDLVARRGKVLAIIEVKSRAAVEAAAHAVTPRQRRRIARAAEALVVARPDLGGLAMRFDLMLVAPGRLPRHWRDAWRAEGR
jgi:putative endonuclease